MANTAEIIVPLRPAEFGLIEHKARRFNAEVSGKFTAKELEDPALWVNCAQKLQMGAEIRCIADDMSFVAYGICTFAQGSTAKIKIIAMHKLDAVDHIDTGPAGDFEVKFRGPKKWSIINNKTGEVVKEDIATQLECLRDLEDYKKALRS